MTLQFTFRAITVVSLLSGCCCAVLAENPPLSLPWLNTEVRAMQNPEDQRYVIEIGEGKAAKRLPLPYSVRSIEGMSIVADRLVVLGRHSHSWSVCIIDLADAKQLLETSCFRPVASPDTSYVAFERFYPRSMPYEFMWPQVEIIDVLADTPTVQALYPPTDAPDQDDPEFHTRRAHVPMSPLVWSKDSRYLAYFDKEWLVEQGHDTWTNSTISLMVFEFDDVKRTNTTKSAAVTVDDFVDPIMAKSADRIGFAVKELKFVDDSVLEALLYPKAYWAFHRFRFDMKKAIASGHLDPAPYSDGVAGN